MGPGEGAGNMGAAAVGLCEGAGEMGPGEGAGEIGPGAGAGEMGTGEGAGELVPGEGAGNAVVGAFSGVLSEITGAFSGVFSGVLPEIRARPKQCFACFAGSFRSDLCFAAKENRRPDGANLKTKQKQKHCVGPAMPEMRRRFFCELPSSEVTESTSASDDCVVEACDPRARERSGVLHATPSPLYSKTKKTKYSLSAQLVVDLFHGAKRNPRLRQPVKCFHFFLKKRGRGSPPP